MGVQTCALPILAESTAAAGRILKDRLAIGPAFARAPDIWLDPAIGLKVRRGVDARGLPIVDGWNAGTGDAVPSILHPGRTVATPDLQRIIARAVAGDRLDPEQIVRLFESDGPDVAPIASAADALRRCVIGDDVTSAERRWGEEGWRDGKIRGVA